MKNVFLKIGIAIVTVAIIVVSFLLIKSKTYNVSNPIATIQIEGYDKPIKIELEPQSAPNAVANFIKLANGGFYNDYTMQIDTDKIVSNESDKLAKMSNIGESPSEDYEYSIKADLFINGIENLIKNKKGVIGMTNYYGAFANIEEGSSAGFSEIYNTANNSFYILTEDADKYNGIYAAFGQVKEGTDVLNAISATRVEEEETNEAIAEEELTSANEVTDEEGEDGTEEEEDMTNKIKIKTITVDTFGVDYGTPEVFNFQENLMQVYSKLYSIN